MRVYTFILFLSFSFAFECSTTSSSRTLHIFIGQLRGGEEAWSSFFKYFFKDGKDEIALLNTDMKSSIPQSKNPLLLRAKYIWEIGEDVEGGIEALVKEHCPSSNWREICNIRDSFQGVGGKIPSCRQVGSAGLLLLLRWYLFEKLQHMGESFEAYTVTRTDYMYLCPLKIPSIPEKNFLYIPSGEEYGGVTDRFAWGGEEEILKYLNHSRQIFCNTQVYIGKGIVNLEQAINFHLLQTTSLSIQKFETSMFTVRTETDPTSWSKGVKEHPFLLGLKRKVTNLRVKYPDELISARISCYV